MKKILACLAVITVLCPLAGCGLLRPEEETTMESTTEVAIKIDAIEVPTTTKPERELINFPQTKPMPEGYSFAPFYATTPTHFYAMLSWKDYNIWEGALYRVPLDNIGQREKISLPEKHDGTTLSRPRICGVTSEWVFVCMAKEEQPTWGGWVVYCVSHKTGKYEFMAECHSTAWYNTGSNSLFLPQRGYIEALNLATEERNVIYEAENFGIDEISDVWSNFPDGTIALEGLSYLHIDAVNQVAEGADFDWDILYASQRYQPKTEIEESLKENREVITYIPCDGWLYCVEREKEIRTLYRIKPDGTGKELLRAKTNIYQLISINNKLYALAAYMQYQDGDYLDYDKVMLHELGPDGKPLWNKPCGANGEDSGTGMWCVGDKIIASQHIYGGGQSEHFVLLYDPATNQFLEGTE